jgi:hypothetical protein
MKPVTLRLVSPRGDELGRLPIAEVVVAGAGEQGGDARPCLDQDMAAVEEHIRAALDREGIEVCLEPLDFRIVVSRALLDERGEADIQIPLPVRMALPGPVPEPRALAENTGDNPLGSLDDLFRLDGEEGNDEPLA